MHAECALQRGFDVLSHARKIGLYTFRELVTLAAHLVIAGLKLRAHFAEIRLQLGELERDTDIEFAEIRYSGKPAAFLRGFRALYLGIPINCIILGFAGSGAPDNYFLSHEAAPPDQWALTYKLVGQICTAYYFLHFLVILPVLGWIERTKPLPNSISESILTPTRTGTVS